jgi:integrase
MANLKLQGSTYHARLTIPKDVRSKFGNKSELWRTTGTGDKRKAAILGAEMVAAWKREVYAARNGINIREWSKEWAKELRQASTMSFDDDGVVPSERKIAKDILIEQLEDMVQDRQITLPEAKAAYEVAIGVRVVLADHKDDYLKQYRNHNLKTQQKYTAAVERFVNRFADDQQVTPKSLKQWLTEMADEEQLAAKTINGLKVQAQAFWTYLVEHEIVQRDPNPFAHTKLTVPKSATKEVSVVPFTPDEVIAFLRSPVAQDDDQLSLLITLGMYTGARIEELAMLKKANLDLKQEVIHFKGTKTKAADREVPMHPVLLPILSTLVSDQEEEYVIPGLTIDARGERGKALGKRFGRLKTAMGFKGRDKVFHSIRKTVGTLFEQSEVLEGVAADILGHEKQTMTYGLYSGGSSIKQKREAVHKLKYPTI